MTEETKIAKIALDTPLHRLFDYLLPNEFSQKAKPGVRVEVPFGRGSRKLIGVLIEITDTSHFSVEKLKSITHILDDEPLLSKEIMQLIHFASGYYHYPLGGSYACALPKLLRAGKTCEVKLTRNRKKTSLNLQNKLIILTAEQQQAVDEFSKNLKHFYCGLLYGITGSGKTEVYFSLIETCLKNQKQILVLVPEIALTPQTLARFQARFPDKNIVLLHSALTSNQRLNQWILAKDGEADIVLGTRSAIFTPLPKLGFIIIDEEHDLSYKQQESLRYHARNLAVFRAQKANIPILLASATPSLETLANVESGRYQVHHLRHRPGTATLPTFQVVDIRGQTLDEGLSKSLLLAIQNQLNQNGQVLLFINRRGFAPTLMCHQCGFIARCNACDANFVLHKSPQHLRCHHCGASQKLPSHCPSCQQQSLFPLGLGTERIEDVLTKHFPNHIIDRIDRDTVQKQGEIEKKLSEVHSGKTHILVGTQMLAKGHDFANVNFVAIIDADTGFYSSELRATERFGQLITQVSGRAGRAEKPGEVWLQTRKPDHPLLLILLRQGYDAFSKALLQERQQCNMPPYAHFALFRAEAKNQKRSHDFLNEIKSMMKKDFLDCDALGPIPATMEKKAGNYRAQLLLQAQNRQTLQQCLGSIVPQLNFLTSAKNVRWTLDVDPLEMF